MSIQTGNVDATSSETQVDQQQPEGKGQRRGFFESARFQTWLDRRMPPSSTITLNQKKIFILPTREGLYFIVVVLFMLLAGINYQNSLIFGIAFLLLSLFMVGMLHTYRNLSGLRIVAGSSRSAFAGEDAEFQVILQRRGERQYEALQLGWNKDLLEEVDLVEKEEVRVKLYVPSTTRGILNPGRLLIQTVFPLGLFRSWTWQDLDVSTIIYPRPIQAGNLPPSETLGEEGELVEREGADDFYGMRDYNPGDPLKHIAWKSFARTETLMVKQFASHVDRRVWIEWDYLSGLDLEARLSRLCYWVIKYARRQEEYGLKLPGIEIAPGRGDRHRDEMLKNLALFKLS